MQAALSSTLRIALTIAISSSLWAAQKPRVEKNPEKRAAFAIDAGLAWLARHQSDDGSWLFASLAKTCAGEASCAQRCEPTQDHFREGLTGLALLAFLQQGYAPAASARLVDPATKTEIDANAAVARGLDALLAVQNDKGGYAKSRTHVYNHAIALLAMCEAARIGKDEKHLASARKATAWLVAAQKRAPSDAEQRWGWRYMSFEEPSGEPYPDMNSDSDTSATGWAIAGLRAARDVGIDVPQSAFDGAIRFVQTVTKLDGTVGYQSADQAGVALDGAHADEFRYHAAALSAIATHLLLDAGEKPTVPFFARAKQAILSDAPQAMKSGVDYYYWLHAAEAWRDLQAATKPKSRKKSEADEWLARCRDVLCDLQDASDGCSRGGWIKPDRWAYEGGPAYMTAAAVLTLQLCAAK